MNLTQFDLGSAGRIADVVRQVESQANRRKPLTFDPIIESRSGGGGGGGQAVRLQVVTFSGDWAVGATKTVTFVNTTSTVSVLNSYCGIKAKSGTCEAMVANTQEGWRLVQPKLVDLANYASTGTQVLGSQDGLMQWIGTTGCETSPPSP